MVNALAAMAIDLSAFAIRKLTKERNDLRVENEALRATVASLEAVLKANAGPAPKQEGASE